jgi:hypothetical protein
MPAGPGVTPALPENYVTAHRHVKLEILPAARLFVAGDRVNGLVDISCSSKEVWFGDIALELVGIEGRSTRERRAPETQYANLHDAAHRAPVS